MSGHSKWHSIKHKKGAIDAKRGKIFTMHAKLIAVAARAGGGDPLTNASLRTAIDNARADNVPNANIERSIKSGTGELKDQAAFSESMYEGFGPEGIAVYIQTISDNKNRTVASLKNILSKNGGNMAGAGSVSWMFHQKGLIHLKVDPSKRDDLELAAIDAGAEDVKSEGESVEVYTNVKELNTVKAKLEQAGFSVEKADMSFIPEKEVKIESEEAAKKVLNLIEALEEDDDVNNVYANFDIPEEILNKVAG
ncbi:YebC/PmpR family DNA-binding transcriptional regulator [Candidatus Peregrinibacteria bacterium]|nr:YebC/PmpR family DNA-binding transcriptional regulator [Candidatus Peregrinibacteria bacterium]